MFLTVICHYAQASNTFSSTLAKGCALKAWFIAPSDQYGSSLVVNLIGCLQILSAPGNVVHNAVDPLILLLGPTCKRVGFDNVPVKKDFSVRC